MQKQKITKFKIGKFTNGACDVFGFMISGKLFGIIVSTDYKNLYPKFSFIKTNEFVDKYCLEPMFLKRMNFIQRQKLKSRTEQTDFIFKFLDDTINLPKNYLKYACIINNNKRKVLFEKKSETQLFKEHSELDGLDEWNLLNLLSKRETSGIIRKVSFSIEPSKNKSPAGFDKDCYVSIPTIHHGSLFIVFDIYVVLGTFIQMYVENKSFETGVKKDFEKIREIISKNQKL